MAGRYRQRYGETLSGPGFAQRVLGVAAGKQCRPHPGPGREDVLRIVV